MSTIYVGKCGFPGRINRNVKDYIPKALTDRSLVRPSIESLLLEGTPSRPIPTPSTKRVKEEVCLLFITEPK